MATRGNNKLAFQAISGREDFTDEQNQVRRKAMKIGEEIIEESCILLKNEGLLPLKKRKVNVFGAVAAQPYFGGKGSSCADNSRAVEFYTALEKEGIMYNPELYSLYKNWVKKKKVSLEEYPPEETTQKFQKSTIVSTIYEVFSRPYQKELPAKYLTEKRMQKAAEFSDTACYVMGRSGSEQHDMTPQELRLMKEERETIRCICRYFENVIIILNTANVFELGFIEEFSGIKAVLSIGFPARTGMNAVARILTDKACPSGHTTDTWYYRTNEHPAFPNVGRFRYRNAKGRSLLEYKEDIYVGYRYSETFLGKEEYKQKIQFPFGYGLSYTKFDWNRMSAVLTDEGLRISCQIQNTGSFAGKDLVQIYVRSPYTGKIEKPALVLAGFYKTKLLDPGQAEDVTLTIPLYDFASYSEQKEAYLLEAGEYGICFARNAHEVKEEATITLGEYIFDRDPDTGKEIHNRFAFARGTFQRLKRIDGASATCQPPTDEEKMAATEICNYPDLKKKPVLPKGLPYACGEDHRMMLSDLKGCSFEDVRWEWFLDQFTEQEMMETIVYGGYQTIDHERLGVPDTIASDGPAGIHDSVTQRSGISYPSGATVASAWNPSLAMALGESVGAESRYMHVQEWYGPSLNLHRSPFGGRCFEYYSEDPYLSGKLAAACVRGAQSQGLVCHIKHFALNEEDRERMHVHTWCSEQAIREIYIKPFEIVVKEGKALGVMSALNCIGEQWCGECSALLTGVLREEWEFRGCVVTDYAGMKYQRADTGVVAGNDLWLAPTGNGQYIKQLQQMLAADHDGTVAVLRQRVKNICYMVLHTHAMK